jgi:hypothetical protein
MNGMIGSSGTRYAPSFQVIVVPFIASSPSRRPCGIVVV